MNYNSAMKTADKPKWYQVVNEEHKWMINMGVWEAVPRSNVPKDSKVISTTWVMKKNTNGNFRARVNARGFMQIEGEHYIVDSIPYLLLTKPPLVWYLCFLSYPQVDK